ncbi:MAG: DNA recombination/repair protein RecA, partial [Oscillospiraceae bacterium]|nr:DNA recombination/repair protein RecA [Oscillospiraceae bacterium]
SWFSYKDERLGQGRDNIRVLIKENPELAAEIEKQVRENIDKLNPARRTVAPRSIQPTEIPIEAAAKVTAGAAKAKIDISVDD